ncbi:MAG: deoxyguanosinetriphosphate triphosphohydrolase [Mycobacterium sp.]|nr:deoxyguanosinetriphosphate triphosphohydrolase [Mycobacterium sp.]
MVGTTAAQGSGEAVGCAAGLARRVAERPSASGRGPFERDRARVLHSAALRRLAGKTQVVGPDAGDFPRTRLTHSLECAQIGREIAGALGADADLVDAACLAHDLGHPPFGHNGEHALDVAAASCGGFEGNAQSLRLLTRLEVKVLDDAGASVGLNLTRATLDATVKYPWLRPAVGGKFGAYADDADVLAWIRQGRPAGAAERPLEADIMDWADDVAYSVHDLEDGIHSGLVDLDQLADPAMRDHLCAITSARYSAWSPGALRPVLDEMLARDEFLRDFDGSVAALAALKRTTSALTGRFCRAAQHATRLAYGDGPLRGYAARLVVPTQEGAECALLKGVTAHFVMARDGAAAQQALERELIGELVALLVDAGPAALDPALRPGALAAADDAALLRVVIDQVASLTDRSVRRRHAELAGRPRAYTAVVGLGGDQAAARGSACRAAVGSPAGRGAASGDDA